MGIAKIVIDIAVNHGRAQNDISDTAGTLDNFKNAAGKAVVPATIVAGAIAGIGLSAANAASDTQQAMGAVESVFGTAAGSVKAYADSAASAVGLSKTQYANLAAVTGASLKSMGLSQDDAAKATQNLITQGADLAATFGGTTEDAVQALGSALRGEADPAERFGLNLKQSAVAAKMAADGTDKLTGTALEAARAQAIMALATEQAAGANGQFAREQDSAAGAAQIAAAQYENAKSALGEQLLPVMAKAAEVLGDLAKWVSENTGLVTVFLGVIGGLAAAVLAVNAAFAVASAAQTAWAGAQAIAKGMTAAYTAVQAAFNAVMLANPIGVVIIAILALVAGIILLWNNCEAFREFFINLWETIAGAATAAWDAITTAAGAAWDWIKSTATAAWEAVQKIIDSVIRFVLGSLQSLGQFAIGVWNGIKDGAAAAWNWIKSTVTGIIDGIKSAFTAFGTAANAVWESIKSVAGGIWSAIRSAAETALAAIMWPINKVKSAIDAVINGIKSAISWAQNLLSKIPVIGGLFGSSAAASAPLAASALASGPSGSRFWVPAGNNAPSLMARGVLSAGLPVIQSSAQAPQVVVNGALDPVAVARQITAILRAQARRDGGTAVA